MAPAMGERDRDPTAKRGRVWRPREPGKAAMEAGRKNLQPTIAAERATVNVWLAQPCIKQRPANARHELTSGPRPRRCHDLSGRTSSLAVSAPRNECSRNGIGQREIR